MSVFTDTSNTDFEAMDEDTVVLTPPDIDVTLPDLSEIIDPQKIQITDLTTGVINGTGVFDSLMSSINAQLVEQFKNNRITIANFGQVYSSSLVQALSIGLQFLQTKEQTYYNNLLILEQVKQAKLQNTIVELNIEKTKLEAQLIYLQSIKENANIVLVKAQIGLSEMDFQIKQKQLLTMDKDIEVKDKQIEILDKDLEVKDSQILNLDKDLLVKDADIVIKGKQALLYEEQKNAFIIDPKLKVANLYSNAYVTNKTADEALTPPDQFTNAEIDEVLVGVRAAVSL